MSVDLAVPNSLGATAQTVQDQNGNPSALAIGSTNVGIGTGPLNPNLPLTVSGNPGTAPIMEVASQSNEASIRYICSDHLGWHVGSGAGEKNFFFWNPQNGIVLLLSVDGTIHAKNLKVTGFPEVSESAASTLQPLLIDPTTGQISRLQQPGPLH